ncbi:MAG: type II toxin-antitoxin system HicB family antitoxin [Bacillota bacterium]
MRKRRIDMVSRDLEFYMSQNYPITLRALTQEEGGGWFAEIKELPGCMADGETEQEALANIQASKKLWLSAALKRGRRVPMPQVDDQEEYSGRLTVRMPKSLHRKIAALARKEGSSLNQFILAALAFDTGVFESAKKAPQEVHIIVEERPIDLRTAYLSHLSMGSWNRCMPYDRGVIPSGEEAGTHVRQGPAGVFGLKDGYCQTRS